VLTRNRCNRRPRHQSFIDNPLPLFNAPRPRRRVNAILPRRHLVSTSSMVDT
jgi:hypothetical protein